MDCCFACILQSGGGSRLRAQIGALQQSWRAIAPADFARVKFCVRAVAVRYAHLAARAVNMRTGGGKCSFVCASSVVGGPFTGTGMRNRNQETPKVDAQSGLVTC